MSQTVRLGKTNTLICKRRMEIYFFGFYDFLFFILLCEFFIFYLAFILFVTSSESPINCDFLESLLSVWYESPPEPLSRSIRDGICDCVVVVVVVVVAVVLLLLVVLIVAMEVMEVVVFMVMVGIVVRVACVGVVGVVGMLWIGVLEVDCVAAVEILVLGAVVVVEVLGAVFVVEMVK